MAEPPLNDLSKLVEAIQGQEPDANAKVTPSVFKDVRVIARALIRQEDPGLMLQPTSLVAEAYVRLAKSGTKLNDRRHVVNGIRLVMKRILIDRARKRRLGEVSDAPELDAIQIPAAKEFPPEQIEALYAALDTLRETHPQHVEIIELKFFAGQSNAEIAEMLGMTEPTVKGRWVFARALLHQMLSPDDEVSKGTASE